MQQALLSKFEKEKQLLIDELTKSAFEEFKKGMQIVAAGILLDAESFISTTDYRDQVVFSLRIPQPVEPTKEEGEEHA